MAGPAQDFGTMNCLPRIAMLRVMEMRHWLPEALV
jgi:hypothetical protein